MQGVFINVIQALAYYVFITNSDTNQVVKDYNVLLTWARNFVKQFHDRLRFNGKIWTLARYKSIYNGVKGFVLGVENYQGLLGPFIKTSRQGVPIEVLPIIGLLDGSSIGIRVIMTVLRIFESIRLPKEFDESSITSEYTGKPLKPLLKDFTYFIHLWLNRFGYRIKSNMTLANLKCNDPSFRFKVGPMGQSILTSHLCALALDQNIIYLQIFQRYCIITKSSELYKQFVQALNLCTESVNQQLIVGRISLTSEGAGKTRLFAICNFGIQSVLKPLHDQLMLTLKLFSSDGTFDQGSQFNRICKETKGKKTYCFDLSKATDRFPLVLQQVLLGVLVGNEYAKCGVQLIGSLPFTYNGINYRWKVGQPLGAFSSGAMFALTHHMIMQYCYGKVSGRISGFNKYAILGDDVVIGHEAVAEYYQFIISYIGVEINFSKSFVGLTNSGEFAKRHFYHGKNISGFGYQMVSQAIASVTDGIRFLDLLEDEGFTAVGAILLYPGHNVIELSKTLMRQLNGLGALRNSFAHNILMCYGNIVISHQDLLQQYVLERIVLLYRQASSSLKRKDYLRLMSKINSISKRGGVTVRSDCLDISFVNNELVSHSLVRYLNQRNRIIFNKIQYLNEQVQSNLFSTKEILGLKSYSDEEFIPTMSLDIFYTDDINQHKYKVKNSVQSKAILKLMKLM